MNKSIPGGIVGSIVTPFLPGGAIDWAALERETALLDRTPIDGICIGGLLSGTAGAPVEELHSLCQTVRKATRKPLFAMVYPDVQVEAAEFVRSVVAAGADLVLVAQPHYLCQPTIADLADMFLELRKLSSVPLLAADCFSDAPLGANGIRTLLDRKAIDGVLETHDAHVLVDLMPLRRETVIFSGIEDLHYMGILLGVHGIVSDLATVFPEEVVAMHQSAQSEDHDGARERHERLCRLWRMLNFPAEKGMRFRAALNARGRAVGPARSPYNIDSEEFSQVVRSVLQREGVACDPS